MWRVTQHKEKNKLKQEVLDIAICAGVFLSAGDFISFSVKLSHHLKIRKLRKIGESICYMNGEAEGKKILALSLVPFPLNIHPKWRLDGNRLQSALTTETPALHITADDNPARVSYCFLLFSMLLLQH